jgi:hypothetical protein
MVPCKDCICLPACVNCIKFHKDYRYSFGYYWHGFKKECSLVQEWLTQDPTYKYYALKEFFLKTKGLIK